MENITRDHARILQQGVRDSRKWKYGPLTLHRIEYQHSMGYAVILTFWRCSLQLGLTVAE